MGERDDWSNASDTERFRMIGRDLAEARLAEPAPPPESPPGPVVMTAIDPMPIGQQQPTFTLPYAPGDEQNNAERLVEEAERRRPAERIAELERALGLALLYIEDHERYLEGGFDVREEWVCADCGKVEGHTAQCGFPVVVEAARKALGR